MIDDHHRVTNFIPFSCFECGGPVIMQSALGITRQLTPGCPLPVPAHVQIPRCLYCGESYIRPEDGRSMDQALLELT